MNVRRLAIAVALSAMAVAPAAAVELHVVPSGDDGHAGTAAAPLQSLETAQAKARRMIDQRRGDRPFVE